MLVSGAADIKIYIFVYINNENWLARVLDNSGSLVKNECQCADGGYGVLLPIGSFGPDTSLTIKATLLYIYAAELGRLFSIKLPTVIIVELEYTMDHAGGHC